MERWLAVGDGRIADGATLPTERNLRGGAKPTVTAREALDGAGKRLDVSGSGRWLAAGDEGDEGEKCR
ncbi:hypothetical protein PR202_gb07909 [Eleusine coracana subsp. coracana]|uniref:Uncharacterized protein n=1 Tax=Eleusine coracana subsp. coracana TaxID=191504 RepID=A0AAV5EDE8_ELECO|nr:hypothetical protein PR202_gb07909 [Eleusine coracana subsp. coracana]